MHSYARREWAMRHMESGYLGRETIAAALGIPPRTISSWYRDETRRGPSLMKNPREFERALGVLLLDKFPGCASSIAGYLHTTPRVIAEWRIQVRGRRYTSELIWATRLAMVVLNPFIHEYFKAEGSDLTLTYGRFPDSSRATDLIFQVYDDVMRDILELVHLRQTKRLFLDFEGMEIDGEPFKAPAEPAIADRLPRLHRLNGPHKYRATILHSDGHVDVDTGLLKRRASLLGIMQSVGSLRSIAAIQIAEGDFQDTFDSSPYIHTKKKLKIKFDGKWVYWNEKDTLRNYWFAVHPNFRNVRAG